MSNLTITEKYSLCMLKEFKKIENFSQCLATIILIEMMLEDSIEINNYNTTKIFEDIGKIKVKLNKEPINEYSKKLYDIIKEMNKPEIQIIEVIKTICFGKSGFSDKNIKMIIEELKQKMKNDKLIALENKEGIFGEKEIIVLDEEKFSQTVQEIRTKILGKQQLEDEFILLVSALFYSGILKNMFSKYEQSSLKAKIKEIEDTKIFKLAKISQRLIDDDSTTSLLTMSLLNLD